MTRSRSNILPLLCGSDEKLKQTGSVVVLDVLLLTFIVQMSAAYTSLMKYLNKRRVNAPYATTTYLFVNNMIENFLRAEIAPFVCYAHDLPRLVQVWDSERKHGDAHYSFFSSKRNIWLKASNHRR